MLLNTRSTPRLLKKVVKSILPPLIADIYRSLDWSRRANAGDVVKFSGNYKSFEEAVRDCDTYEADLVIKKYLDETRKCIEKKSFDITIREQRKLSAVAVVLARHKRLRVLDFGGVGGGDYYWIRFVLGAGVIERWVVVENKKVVDAFKKEKANEVEFISDINAIVPFDYRINFALVSGSLQYVENPLRTLQQITKLNPDFVLIARTPFWDRPNRLMKQAAPKHIYGGRSLSYPCWFLNEQEVRMTMAANGYDVLFSYDAPEDSPYIPGYGPLYYRGIFFRSRKTIQPGERYSIGNSQ